MWHKVIEFMEACKYLRLVDGPLIAQYCQTWSYWKRAEELLNAHGETYTVTAPGTGQPMMVEWPQASSTLRLAAHLNRLEKQLGISRFMRASLPVNARPESPHAQFVRRQRYLIPDRTAERKQWQRRIRAQQRRLSVDRSAGEPPLPSGHDP